LVSHALQEDATMRQSDTATDISCPASIDATASTLEGGRASGTDSARRLAPYGARAPSRDRVLA
jgi:SRSO17 transposase